MSIVPEYALKRMDTCNSCELLLRPQKVCLTCACFMPLKTTFKGVECPEGKWGKIA